jgi:2-polyprenyl-6-methoxyphenol hydroxylase-like FAD-dependent oxidoreductase
MIDRRPAAMSLQEVEMDERARIGMLFPPTHPNLNDQMTPGQRAAFELSVHSGNSVSDPRTVVRGMGAIGLNGATAS